jgi:hypothetical protein
LDDQLRKQHDFSGHDEKLSQGDFTHQMITTATELDPATIRMANAAGDRRANSGWAGDVTYVALMPNMGNGDYKADLDAVATAQRGKANRTLDQALTNYYTGLAKGNYTRAQEFLKTYPMDKVQERTGVFIENGHTIGLADNTNPVTQDARNFVYSLNANSNDYLTAP